MASYTVTISTPTLTGTETFSVSYQRDTDPIVVVDAETNAAFTLSGLTAGNYKLYIELNGQTSVYCFTITETCTCPTITDIVMSETDQLWYITATIALPTGLPPCGITVTWTGVNGDNGSVDIIDISQLLLISGTDYSFKAFPIGQNQAYDVKFVINCCTDQQKVCTTARVFQTCDPPQAYPPHSPYFFIFKTGSDYFMRVTAQTAGLTCHTFTVTYTQLYVTSGAPDSGVATETVSTTPPFPKLIDIPLSPNPLFSNPFTQGEVRYSVEYTDCCGNHGYGTVIQI